MNDTTKTALPDINPYRLSELFLFLDMSLNLAITEDAKRYKIFPDNELTKFVNMDLVRADTAGDTNIALGRIQQMV